ncbi:MAG: arginine N-succinyltransferase [Rhodanobacteraceae bacterium]|nr:arginine N-succinyltransferase [Rhodanobacteraceae bacterium]
MTTCDRPTRFLLRPCTAEDLPALERFAAASPVGITTLPHDRAFLTDRLQRSLHSFATDDASGEEIYLFALEDLSRGNVVGISGIAARAGFADPFYSFRNEFVVHASRALGISTRIHTLQVCHDLTDVSLFISFHIDPAYTDTLAPQLLSRARLLFISQFPERFSDRVAAESAGLADDSGRCPLWDAVGRQFFGMDYPTIERLTGGRSKTFIADLMPPSPIYVPLLPEEAQFAIGQLHPIAELPFSILIDEGFDADTYVDLFDGGPTAQERLAMLKTVSRARRYRARAGSVGAGDWHLLCNPARGGFRATLALAHAEGEELLVDAGALQCLGVVPGGVLRAARLDTAQGGER